MKLLNPNDAELNAAFAEKVCGWKRLQKTTQIVFEVPGTGARGTPPDFTTSADAVLPWLEKYSWMHYDHYDPEKGYNNISICDWASGRHLGAAQDKGFAKTAVLALLRAHGVEIEFTQ